MKRRQEHAVKQEWSAEYSSGMFGILMGGAFGLTITPYLVSLYYILSR